MCIRDSINTEGYQKARYDPIGKGGQLPDFTLREGQGLSDITISLTPAFRISGRVLDENGNPPAISDGKHVSVYAWSEGSKPAGGEGFSIAAQAIMNPDGTYALDGLDGTPVYVQAIDNWAAEKDDAYPPRYYPGTFSRSQATPLTFDGEKAHTDIDIRLAKTGGAVLDGTVTDRETGKAISGALVTVHHDDMLFDRVLAYTDENGQYHLEGLSDGKMLVHVDAAPCGWVRTTKELVIRDPDEKCVVDVTLRKGVIIKGRLVDRTGNPLDIGSLRCYGWAIAATTDGKNPNRSFSAVPSKHYPQTHDGHGPNLSFSPTEGDYRDAKMIFPTKSTFEIYGLMPGDTTLSFDPKRPNWQFIRIRTGGKDLPTMGKFKTTAGEVLEDVELVVKTD